MKIQLKLFFVLFCLAWFISCEETPEEPQESDPYFTLEVKESYKFDANEKWIILTNSSGEVLEHLKFSEPGTYVFSSPQSTLEDQIGVYMFTHYPESNSFGLSGYLNIDKGEILELSDLPSSTTVKNVGSAYVFIANYPTPAFAVNVIAVNNSEGFAYLGSEKIDFSTNDEVVDTMKFKIPLAKTSDTLLLANDMKDHDGRYIQLEGVEDGDTLILDFNEDFKPYDTSVKKPLSPSTRIFSSVYGYTPEGHDILLSIRIYSSGILQQLGYVDGYEYYSTSIHQDDYEDFNSVYIYKLGEKLTEAELDLPDNNFTISNNSFNEFEYSFNGSLDYKVSFWTYDEAGNTYDVAIYAPVNSDFKNIISLPSELVETYPAFDLNKLEYSSSSFTDVISGYPYRYYSLGRLEDASANSIGDFYYRYNK